MKQQLKIFPFHIFLLPVFFVWHVVNQYFGLIPISFSGRFLLYYLGLSLVLFLTGKLVFRNNSKAGCWTTLLLIIFFFWGAIHDFLRTINLPVFLISYKFLFSLVFILVIAIIFFLSKKDAPLQFSRFLTLLFGLFVLGEALLSVYKLATRQKEKNNLTYYNQPLTTELATISDSLKPDIFLIILDEYASSPALQRYLDYDNSQLDSMLANNSFFTATGSKSNYNSTPLSIASMLNMQYFEIPLEGKLAGASLVLKGQHTLKNSLVPQLLKKQGYKIVNLGLCDIEGAPAKTESFFNSNAIEVLYLETLWGRVEKEIWWNVRERTAINWTFMRSSRQIDILQTNSGNFAKATQELNTPQSYYTAPKFVIVHLMLPHHPFFFTKEGNLRSSAYTDNPILYDSLYIDQLVYTNTWIEKIVKSANKKSRRPRAVIITGDHGYRDKENDPATRDKQFMNLDTWYFSDGNSTGVHDSISSVNYFRVILNKYFRTDLAILKDSTIRLIE